MASQAELLRLMRRRGHQTPSVNLPLPAHYWRMDEHAAPLVDLVAGGTFNLAGAGSVASVSGKRGTGTLITGAQLAGTGEVFGNVARSFASWFKPGAASGPALTLWVNDAGANTTVFYNSTSHHLWLEVGTDDEGITFLDANVYHLAVYTHDGLGNHKLYVDNVLQVTKSAAVGGTSAPIILLPHADFARDETAYFTTGLTPVHVATLWNGGAGVFYNGNFWAA